MAYVPDSSLTDEYLQTLIARAGFTDVTAEIYGSDLVGIYYAIRDLNGRVTYYDGNRPLVRDQMITQYLIQQNS